ncbi:exonuclease domain-containing protein [Helicobacter pametensis]|uniref:exonuclease domain-containing protein n=1 Tax=Helicobacter pametensis TaxID=95149 RepID=UPI0004B3AED1|nr:exonuclease domain-containing protein [Helicobacter pametensis]
MHPIIQDPSLKPKPTKSKLPPSPSKRFVSNLANKTLEIQHFLNLCSQDEILKDLSLDEHCLDFLLCFGLDLQIQNSLLYLGSKDRTWQEQIFCFVDIETTHALPQKGNLLEIGAILCNGRGEILGRFEQLVHNTDIPPFISEITGIQVDDVKYAPPIQHVLQEFRSFVGTSILVAHNVNFDYNFLDFLYLKYFKIGLYNQTLCTLKIAQKTLQSPKYNLAFLNESLGIHTPIAHRAYADAQTCMEIFKYCSKFFPSHNMQNILNWLSHS